MSRTFAVLLRRRSNFILLGSLGVIGVIGTTLQAAESDSYWSLIPFLSLFFLGCGILLLLQRLIDVVLTFRRAEEKRIKQLGVVVRESAGDVSALYEVLAEEIAGAARVHEEARTAAVSYHMRETTAGLQLINNGVGRLNGRLLDLVTASQGIGSVLVPASDDEPTQHDASACTAHQHFVAFDEDVPDASARVLVAGDIEYHANDLEIWNSNLITWIDRIYFQSGGVAPRSFTVAPRIIQRAAEAISKDAVIVDFGIDSLTYFLSEYGNPSLSLYVIDTDIRLSAISAEALGQRSNVFGAVDLAIDGILGQVGVGSSEAICILVTEPSSKTMELLGDFCRSVPSYLSLKIISVPRLSEVYTREPDELTSLLKSWRFIRQDAAPDVLLHTWGRPANGVVE
ncbi:hypothetical protein [Arthrobacter dokdonensis]|uniref:hypothetical protein n=1 Tax=Arthrobacter dokdonellae TaxID=2211210 RepID=UPI001013CD6F|nr:hypothetical protein [Arthrobacter dokdonellae]